jgi:hypothetical protein
MTHMGHVSRPLIGLLVATVAFFAVWTIALKPHSSSSGGGSSGAGSNQSAIDKAHQAVTSSNNASVAHGGTVATSTTQSVAQATTTAPTASTPAQSGTSTTAAGAKTSTGQSAGATAAATAATTKDRAALITHALRTHKVVALLFFNPRASDDQAVQRELGSIPVRRGAVVKLAIPLKELSDYPVVTTQVPVNASPTLVFIDRSRQASKLIGYASTFEIAHRIDDALAVK